MPITEKGKTGIGMMMQTVGCCIHNTVYRGVVHA